MAFTDQKPFVVTENDMTLPWSGRRDGSLFRCYLCGHYFKPGDVCRWAFGQGRAVNFMTCQSCDGPDVLDRWVAMGKEAKDRYWWFMQNEREG